MARNWGEKPGLAQRFTVVAALVLLGPLFAVTPAQAQWGPEIALTNTGGDVFGEGIATAGQSVHVVYGNGDVKYRSSSDDGGTWSDERTLDAGVLHLTDPMVADGEDVWTIYLKNITTLTDWCCARDVGDIFLLHSGDGGASWDPPQQLTTGAAAFRVSIAYSADRLHIVWMDYRDAAWDTYYLRSNDRGASWEEAEVIAAGVGTFGSERPQVAARGDAVHVTMWDDRGVNPPCMAGPTFSFEVCPDTFHIGSLDGGASWSAPVPVDYSGAALAGRNDIAVTGSSSVVVNFNRAAEGTADANPHMFAVRSPDNGATWEPPTQLTNTPGSSDHGSIIGDGPSVFLAWHDSRSGVLEIRYAHSTDEGQTWIADEKASTPRDTEASTPLVATTEAFVHLLWLDKRTGPYQVYYRRRERPVIDSGNGGGGTGDGGGGTSMTSAAGGAGSGGDAAAGGAGSSGEQAGCDCRSASGSAPSPLAWLLGAVTIARARSRRRLGLRRPS